METKAENNDSTEKGLLQTAELYKYIMDTSVYPREQECLKELRAITSTHPRAIMGTAPDAGQFMALLLKAISAKKTIEIGVFTGYSLLITALAIPDDGEIKAIDMDRSSYQIGLPIIERAGVKHKINYIESEALPVLDQLVKDPENREAFDFAFVDADKVNYANYHERMMKLLRPGGIVVYDNTLWGGTVAMDEGSVPESKLATRNASLEFNKYIAGDSRVQISQLPLGDGLLFVAVSEALLPFLLFWFIMWGVGNNSQIIVRCCLMLFKLFCLHMRRAFSFSFFLFYFIFSPLSDWDV